MHKGSAVLICLYSSVFCLGQSAQAPVKQKFARIPLTFEENQGQARPEARFLARTGARSVMFTDRDVAFFDDQGHTSLRWRITGGTAKPHLEALDPVDTLSNYFIGSQSDWHTNIRNVSRIVYKHIYRGVDLAFRGAQSQMEYDFVVAPGADPNCIEMEFSGARSVQITPGGDLKITATGFELIQHRPMVYQRGLERVA